MVELEHYWKASLYLIKACFFKEREFTRNIVRICTCIFFSYNSC